MRGVRQLMAAAAVVLCVDIGRARPPDAPRLLTDAEEHAVATCLTLVRECQLPDGAFAQVKPGDRPHAPVWIAPYFANYAALALLAGHAHTKNLDDFNRVGCWLEWCARHQSADGYWNDFEGTATVYENNGKVDAWDSSAAMFLWVAGRYRRAGGQATSAIITAAKKAFACIATVTDQDGLTWATPTHTIKYLMDNVEVCAGLRSGSEFFVATGSTAAAGTEWWLIAASRTGESEANTWRAKRVKEIGLFTPKDVYLSRPALAALGLLEGADWMKKGEK